MVVFEFLIPPNFTDEYSSSNDVNVNVNSYAILEITGALLNFLIGVKRESGRSWQELMPATKAPAASATVSECGYII